MSDQAPSSKGNELQSEYFVRYEDTVEVFEALYEVNVHFIEALQISEIRFIQADRIPMSPCFGRRGEVFTGIHFTWVKKETQVMEALVHVESALERFNAKPHWGEE